MKTENAIKKASWSISVYILPLRNENIGDPDLSAKAMCLFISYL